MTSIGPSYSRNFLGIFFGDGSQRMKNIDGLLKVSNRPRGTLSLFIPSGLEPACQTCGGSMKNTYHLPNNILRIGFSSQMALCQPIQKYHFDTARRATVPS